MTQASKRRSQAEKARGFSKSETPEQRQQRIAGLKARMPCSACKANGRTTFGHWRSDPECPFFGKADPKPGKSVFVVAHENDVLSTSSEDVYMVHVSTVYGTDLHPGHCDGDPFLALSDTCRARTVAGATWMQKTMQALWKSGHEFYVLPEQQAFRFGAGPRIHSEFAVVLPTCLGGPGMSVYLRVSVVPVDVPLLVSRQALLDMGAVMDMPNAIISFKQLGTSMSLQTTPSNHLGFQFWKEDACTLPDDPDLWVAMDETEKEVIICNTRTMGVESSSPNIPEPPHNMQGRNMKHTGAYHVHTAGCSSQSSEFARSVKLVGESHDGDVGTQAQGGLCDRHCRSTRWNA